jgi:Kyakuja-Dileera-Zisupton transposase
LAIIDRLLKVYGKDLGIGYDIACSFLTTVAKSSISPATREQALQLVVPAFHGYAHNCACQLDHHPSYVVGFGLEDFEGCERIFSSSNFLARLTRHATHFHQHQSIDMRFSQWDENKYVELSKPVYVLATIGTDVCPAMFLFNNCKQVDQILDEMPKAIAALESGKTPDECAYAAHLDAKQIYLASHKKEPEADVITSKYISILKVYKDVR